MTRLYCWLVSHLHCCGCGCGIGIAFIGVTGTAGTLLTIHYL